MTNIETITNIIDNLGAKSGYDAVVSKWKFPDWPDVFIFTLTDTPSVGITSYFARRPGVDLTLVCGSRFDIDVSLDLAIVHNVLSKRAKIGVGHRLENAFRETLPRLPHGTLMAPWPWPDFSDTNVLDNIYFCVPLTKDEFDCLTLGFQSLEEMLIKSKRDLFDLRCTF